MNHLGDKCLPTLQPELAKANEFKQDLCLLSILWLSAKKITAILHCPYKATCKDSRQFPTMCGRIQVDNAMSSPRGFAERMSLCLGNLMILAIAAGIVMYLLRFKKL
jgi:hypothetical protein